MIEEINKFIKETAQNPMMEEAAKKSFVMDYLMSNPDFLSEAVQRVMTNQISKIEKLENKNHTLGINFMPVKELLMTGKVESTMMTSFNGLLGNTKMEESYNKEIVNKIENARLEK